MIGRVAFAVRELVFTFAVVQMSRWVDLGKLRLGRDMEALESQYVLVHLSVIINMSRQRLV